MTRRFKPSFFVFDATLYDNKPNLRLSSIQVNYRASWPPDLNLGSSDNSAPAMATIASVQAMGSAQAVLGYRVVCHDLELYGANKSAQAANYADLADWYNQGYGNTTNLKVGFFDILPIPDFSAAGSFDGAADHSAWVNLNDSFSSAAAHITATFPSCYTETLNPDDWETFARAMVTEAKRLKPNVPCYPFLWPNYVDFGPVGTLPVANTEIPRQYWRRQLSVMADIADGIVIWGGSNLSWKNNATWWRELKRFMGRGDSIPSYRRKRSNS